MDPLISYLLLGLLVFVINLVPAFMPPTWSILAFFAIKYELYLLPTVIVGVMGAVVGRVLLSYAAKHYFRPFFSEKSKKNFDHLSHYFKKHEKLTLPFIFLYAFSPIPSNQLFIIAGLTRFNIKLLTFSFFIGRIISYTFWVGLTLKASDSLENIFAGHLNKVGSIILEIFGLFLIFLVSRIDWSKILKNHTNNN